MGALLGAGQGMMSPPLTENEVEMRVWGITKHKVLMVGFFVDLRRGSKALGPSCVVFIPQKKSQKKYQKVQLSNSIGQREMKHRLHKRSYTCV